MPHAPRPRDLQREGQSETTPSTPPSTLQIRMLGGFQAIIDDREVSTTAWRLDKCVLATMLIRRVILALLVRDC